MNETAWDSLDPEIRAQVAPAAAAQGVSLNDYLTELLLEQALETMLQGEPETVAPKATSFVPPIGKSRETFAVRHRLDAQDRRIAIAVGSLDNAINAVDGSVLSLASRVDETEAVFGEAAETLSQALNELSDKLSGVREQLAAAEGGLSTLNSASASAHAELAEKYSDLDQRLILVDDIARDADRAAADLSLAHELLKQAVAKDFAAFSEDTTGRISADLDQLREAAIAAARHADAAAAQLVSELRTLRESVEARLAESAAETQARMQATFADSAERHAALYARLSNHERAAAQSAEHARARLIDIEDAAQAALEVTADGLRAAHAALAVDLACVNRDGRASVEALRGDTARDLGALRDGQAAVQARLKLADSAIANTIGDVGAARDTIERRIAESAAMARAELAQAHEGWSGRFDALAARLADSASDTADAHHIVTAEIHRVEACTLAALEKATQDRAWLESLLRAELGEAAQARAAADNTLQRELNDATHASRAQFEEMRQRMQHDVAALRGQQAGVQARVDAVAAALAGDGQVGAALKRLPALDANLARVEAALESAETDAALAELGQRVNALAARLGNSAEESLARMEDARTRLGLQETRVTETADRVHDLARLFGRLSAQSADATTQSGDRLHKLELAFADLELAHDAKGGEAAALNERVAAVGPRLAELEQRQTDALEQLRADIAQFLGENDRRLTAIESLGDGADLSAEFQMLRQRVEERLIEAERKSVRALEQVVDTVALIGRKLTGANPEDIRATAAKSA